MQQEPPLSRKFELMVAPNGARKGKSDHPALPITADELAETARACAEAGATAIHVHVRDDEGHHTLDAARYRTAIDAIRSVCDIRIQITTEAVGVFDVTAQIACLAQVRAPEASVALREIERDPARVAQAYRVAEDAGTEVQHILYDEGDVTRLLARLGDGTIPAHFTKALFVLGRYAEGQRSSPDDLAPFLTALGERALEWSVCAFGPGEQDCLLEALRRGGDVRIGFENNTIAPDGARFTDNAAAVATLVAAAARQGFQPRQES